MDVVALENMVGVDSDDEWLDLLLEVYAEQKYELFQASGVSKTKRKSVLLVRSL